MYHPAAGRDGYNTVGEDISTCVKIRFGPKCIDVIELALQEGETRESLMKRVSDVISLRKQIDAIKSGKSKSNKRKGVSSNTGKEDDNQKKRAKVAPIREETKSRGKRVKFTDSEDAAIRNGVDRFGVGRWADIKSYYDTDLADRTSVQIKDRWRTLNK
jgi:hypothetical protein